MTAPYVLRAEVPAERSACNNLGCESVCRCVVESPSPHDFYAELRASQPTDAEREADYQRWLALEEYREARGFYDDVEVADDGE